jgi:hypothetical protein
MIKDLPAILSLIEDRQSDFLLYHPVETKGKLELIKYKCHKLTHIVSGESEKQPWLSSQLT